METRVKIAPGSGHLEVLDEGECYRLLASAPLGRLGVTVGALPAVLPVNFALLGRDVVFRTGRDGPLARAAVGRVVAFEVDQADTLFHEGWSVMVVGWAQQIPQSEPDEALEQLPLEPWPGGDRPVFVRVVARFVTGRRITHHPPAEAPNPPA